MSDSRHGKQEFPVHHGKWPAHGRGTGVLGRPEHAEAEGDEEQDGPKKAAAPRASRAKAPKERAGE